MPKPGRKRQQPQGRRITPSGGDERMSIQRSRVQPRKRRCKRDGNYTNGEKIIKLKKGNLIPPGFTRIRTNKY